MASPLARDPTDFRGSQPPAKRIRRERVANPNETARPKICCVCMDKVPEEKCPAYECELCLFGIYCGECLATLFTRASRSENDMPVACACDNPIPAEAAAGFLTVEQVRNMKPTLLSDIPFSVGRDPRDYSAEDSFSQGYASLQVFFTTALVR